MRFLLCVFFIVYTEAQNSDRRQDYDDDPPSPLQRKVDVFPQHFSEPVPFGHITREGFGDPFSPVKPPLDLLELDMVAPKNSKEAIEMLKKGRKHIQFLKNPFPPNYISPRDKYFNEIETPKPIEINETRLKWYNLPEIQRRNAMLSIPTKTVVTSKKKPTAARIQPPSPSAIENSKLSHFARHMFELNKDVETEVYNWTSCDEFGVGAFLSPKDIVNLEWVPFYIWSLRGYPFAIVHKFVYPTKKVS